jgi:diacylglycerol kinase family enzyme
VIIQKAIGADHELQVEETSRRGHAARLALGAANDGVDVVAVLGGDGTLNEAADGLAGTDTALAPLPGGSTNVYARTIGMADDPIDATAQLLAALDRGSIERVGLGRVEGRHFLFHCGVGFDAAVVEQVERRSAFKKYAAHPLFVASSFNTWLRSYDHKRGRFDVELDTGERVEGATLLIVSKTSPYTYLGRRPMVVAPAAGLHSPLSFTIITARRSTSILSLAGAAFVSARALQRHHDVVQRDGVEAATVTTTGEQFPYQVDGDYLGDVKQLRFQHVPEALRLVVP